MKYLYWIGVLFLLSLTACQPAPPPVTQAPEIGGTDASPLIPPAATATSLPQEPQTTPPSEGYPAAPTQVTAPPANIPTGYPEPSEEISWEQAKTLILEGQVAQATQLHSMKVILVLKDDRVVSTFETAIDEIFAVIDQCGELCSDIIVATE